MSEDERLKVAQELATKDGAAWEGLDDVMHNAYLHNADLVIAERNQVAEGKAPGAPKYTCSVCKDEGFINGNPCRECNPVGLPKPSEVPMDEVHQDIPKKGEYLCTKCNNRVHRETSKIGKKHLKYKVQSEERADGNTGSNRADSIN